MQIQKGLVKYKDRTDIVCTYGIANDGKQYYFLEKDERVYSRYSHQYMNFQDALSEFCSCISDY